MYIMGLKEVEIALQFKGYDLDNLYLLSMKLNENPAHSTFNIYTKDGRFLEVVYDSNLKRTQVNEV